MAAFNKVVLLGNLTRDPELRYTQGGQAVANFGMAVNRVYTSNGEKKEDVCFVDLVAWGKQAEVLNEHMKKGRQLLVEGRLSYSSWDDKETGAKRSKLEVVCETFQFVGGRGKDREPGEDDEAPQAKQRKRVENKETEEYDGIPF